MVGVLVLLVVATGTAMLVGRNSYTDAAPTSKIPVGAAVPSYFLFSGVAGWWQGATNKTSMALFHTPDTDGCFVSVQYYKGTVDAAAELQKLSVEQAGGGTMTPGVILSMTLQTATGSQQYQLHQYALSPDAGEQLMDGLEMGYVQLPDAYVKVEGHCNAPGQLPATIPALQAVKLGKS